MDVSKLDFSGGSELAYSCISLIRYILFLVCFYFPFRALMLREKEPERWKMICSLENHKKERKKNSYWTDKHKPIIKFIRWDKHDLLLLFPIFQRINRTRTVLRGGSGFGSWNISCQRLWNLYQGLEYQKHHDAKYTLGWGERNTILGEQSARPLPAWLHVKPWLHC